MQYRGVPLNLVKASSLGDVEVDEETRNRLETDLGPTCTQQRPNLRLARPVSPV